MAIASLPAAAKIKELRLKISNPNDEAQRPTNRSAPYGVALRELWNGEALFAPMSRADAHGVAAFLESLDGRVTPFKVAIAEGVFRREAAFTASLVGALTPGQADIAINFSPASGVVRAGTLFAVGDIESGPYQMFEVLADAPATTATPVLVAPRVRYAFASDAPVAFGTVYGKFTLAEEAVGVSIPLTQGVASIKVIEAL